MAHIISIISRKGGVGKTTTAVNLAASLALLEKKTLVIDCDPQGNLAASLGISSSRISKNIGDVFMGKADIQEAVYDTPLKYLKCIPAKHTLATVEKAFTKKSSAGIEKIFEIKLSVFENIYDYIIIDTSQSVDFLTKCVLIAAGWVIIPITYHFYTIEGLNRLMIKIKQIKNFANPALSIAGLLLTMYDSRDYISDRFSKEMFTDFDKLIFNTIIPYDRQLQEAVGYGKPIALYNIMAKSAKAHFQLADEIINVVTETT